MRILQNLNRTQEVRWIQNKLKKKNPQSDTLKWNTTKDKEETIKAEKEKRQITSKGMIISLAADFSAGMAEIRSSRILSSNNSCKPTSLTPAKPRFQEQGRKRHFGHTKTNYL